VDVWISLRSDDQIAQLESLSDWLHGEPELGSRVRLVGSGPRQTEMGAWADSLVVAAGAGGVLSVLAGSLRTWLSHPRRSDVRIRVRTSADHGFEIDAKRISTEDIDRLLRQLIDTAE
jgi:Effector Associated Constant Component 1